MLGPALLTKSIDMSIIALTGRIGSGKDTVASIIQELYPEMNWQIKGFADKLRQVASIFIGIPPEELKKQEIKERALGVEWDYFLGKYESIETPHIFSSATKHTSLESCKSFDANGSVKCIAAGHHQMTVRQFLQELGTDAIRNGLHPNSWVNALMCDYKVDSNVLIFHGASGPYPKELGTCKYPNWLITDCRFQNEYDAIVQKEGTCVRIVRPDNPYPHSNHISETALDGVELLTIINDGNLDQLGIKVKEVFDPIVHRICSGDTGKP